MPKGEYKPSFPLRLMRKDGGCWRWTGFNQLGVRCPPRLQPAKFWRRWRRDERGRGFFMLAIFGGQAMATYSKTSATLTI